MKITLSSGELFKKLQILGGVVNSNNTMPILDNFLFEASNKVLTITASDLETTMSTTIDVDFDGSFSVALPAKLLIEVIKTFADQPLIFTIKDNNIVEIKSDNGEYEIPYQSGDEFPKQKALEQTSKATIPSKALGTAIVKTLFATGSDDLRPVMSGVFFQMSSSGLNFVATDAHRLVKYSRTDIQATETAEFIVPKKPLGILKGVLASIDEKVTIEYNDLNACFSFGSYIVTCRLIDGKYPNYDAVIPKDNPNVLSIDRNTLLGSVKRVALFSNRTTHQIRLKIAGQQLHVSTQDEDYSRKGDENLVCNYQGDDLLIGFNSKFLTEMLSNIQSEEVQIEMSLPNRAGILSPIDGQEEGEQLLMLVMPVNLK